MSKVAEGYRMKIVLFTHPSHFGSKSMPRFADMISSGMTARGHDVEIWSPKPRFFNLPAPAHLKKWLGYIDQFIIFPIEIKMRAFNTPSDTLFVFADQALGPWIPRINRRPHVVHCHDFLAYRSSLGEIPQNKTSFTGKLYQKFICSGAAKAKNYIPVSSRTAKDIQQYLQPSDAQIDIVLNGLNYPFKPLNSEEQERIFDRLGFPNIDPSFILHVGGNQWYKNRVGVVKIYEQYVKRTPNPLPLWLVGAAPNKELKAVAGEITPPGKVLFFDSLPNDGLMAAYSRAAVLLFPSLAEGFGWPIVEALACGCPVITTGEEPMTEVGGECVEYLPQKPTIDSKAWAEQGAELVNTILSENEAQRAARRINGLSRAEAFDPEDTLDRYEAVYLRVVGVAR